MYVNIVIYRNKLLFAWSTLKKKRKKNDSRKNSESKIKNKN